MAFLSGIGKWVLQVVLGWLFGLVKSEVEKYQERKRLEKERKEANEAAVIKLEEAQSEEEVIRDGGDLLSR